LQGRRDQSGARIWIVDASTERTIVALDRASGVVAAPDSTMPAWATINGGERIPDTDEARLPKPVATHCPID
jgi:hypothetical protein